MKIEEDKRRYNQVPELLSSIFVAKPHIFLYLPLTPKENIKYKEHEQDIPHLPACFHINGKSGTDESQHSWYLLSVMFHALEIGDVVRTHLASPILI